MLSRNFSSRSEHPDDRERKRQRVDEARESANPADHASTIHIAPPSYVGNSISSFNLAESKDVCSRLCSSKSAVVHSHKKAAMGCHLDFRKRTFEFSHGHAILPPNMLDNTLQGTILGLQDIFVHELQDTFSDPQRFWLASIIVKSALQHYNTGSWPESWTPDQLGFYDLETGDLTDSLKTLHLSCRLPLSSIK